MSVNKVILVGNVGKDPEIRYIDENLAVASFSLATTERGFTRKDGTQVPESTDWHNIVAWRGLAKISESYIRKGTQIYVEGKIKNRSYDDKEGIKRYTTEVIADTIQLLGRKSDNPAVAAAPQASAVPSAKPAASDPLSTTPSSTPAAGTADTSSEDDLPF